MRARLPVDLLGRRPELAEQGLGHRQGDLALAREDDVGPRLAERPMLSEVGRPGEDEDPRVQLAGEADRLARAVHARAAEDQGDRIREAGLLERLAVRRVAVDGPASAGGDLTHRLEVQLDDDRLELVLAEQPGQGPPDGAVADDDGPVRGPESS